MLPFGESLYLDHDRVACCYPSNNIGREGQSPPRYTGTNSNTASNLSDSPDFKHHLDDEVIIYPLLVQLPRITYERSQRLILSLTMLADIPRKAAFDTLLLCFDNVRSAMVAFAKACEDPRLVALPSHKSSTGLEATRPAISFTSLCSHVEKLAAVFHDFENDLKRGTALLKRIRNHSFDIVPIHRLPHELIANIFLLLPKYGDNPQHIRQSDTLSHICHTWRMVALGTPELWSCISLHGQFEAVAKRATSWLERSANCPIEMRASAPSCMESDPGSEDYLNLAFKLYHRWMRLTVDDGNRFYCPDVVTQLTGRIVASPPQDVLEAVTLRGITVAQDELDGFMDAISQNLRNLKTLVLQLTPRILYLSHLPHTITTLGLYGTMDITSIQFSRLLKSCSNLRSLTMDSFSERSPLDNRSWFLSGAGLSALNAAVPLLNLQYLYLARLTDEQWAQFFTSVQAPALKTLTLKLRRGTSFGSGALPPPFAQHFSSTLLQFHVEDDSSTFWSLDPRTRQPHFISTVRSFPLLQSLSIMSFNAPIPEKIFIGLNATSNGQICPFLRDLTIKGPVSCTPQMLADALGSRFLSQPIETLLVNCVAALQLQGPVPKRDAADIGAAMKRVWNQGQVFAKQVHWTFNLDGRSLER
jgi:hypothetical protein